MKTFVNNKEYLQRKLNGENTISAATIYGFNAITTKKAAGRFSVLVLNNNDFSYYEYVESQGKFMVEKYEEAKTYNITDIITPDMLQNDAIMRWWSCVFFEDEDKCRYDTCYDSLKISNESEVSFKELIGQVVSCVSFLPHPSSSSLFITGELKNVPLIRYVLQNKMSIKSVYVLHEFSDENNIRENEIVLLPKDKLDQLLLHTSMSNISFSTLVSDSINITLPIISIDAKMFSELKWKEMLVDNEKDYSVGNMGFKTINLMVECDSFQNIFIKSRDVGGNILKVKQIK